MTPTAPGGVDDTLLRELGGTHGGTGALAVLIAGQHTLRLLQLRALSDAVTEASGPAAGPFRQHWRLLEAADRADRDATRRVLFYPLVGPWVLRCLRGLGTGGHQTELSRDLSHLGALAVAAAVRAGLTGTVRLAHRAGLVTLPTLGAWDLSCGQSDPAPGTTELRFTAGRLIITVPNGAPAVVRRRPDGTWRSHDPRWRPLRVLTGGPRQVLLDELDPFGTADSGLERHGLRPGDRLSPGELELWQDAWRGTPPLIELGGPSRTAEVEGLLECLVPLAAPPAAAPHGGAAAHCSGTRREAFGAVLSSTPRTPGYLAATLVHELQHAKLSALSDLVPLHTAGPQHRYWAPWRPDPRPFDGLLQGAYSHLALAEYWQLFALAAKDAAERDKAWAEHSRCREQVGAALPALAGSQSLTREGRVFVDAMVRQLTRLKDHPPPQGHLARASAYVATARRMWRRQTSGGEPPVYVPSRGI